MRTGSDAVECEGDRADLAHRRLSDILSTASGRDSAANKPLRADSVKSDTARTCRARPRSQAIFRQGVTEELTAGFGRGGPKLRGLPGIRLKAPSGWPP